MRAWKLWTCAAALWSGWSGALRAEYPHAQAQHPYAIGTPMVQFVEEEHGPCRAGIMAGASLYFLRPYYTNDPAFVTTTGIGTATPVVSSEDFDWNFHVAPAAWLGWTSECGVGFRGRFFHFEHDSEDVSTSLDATAAAAGVTITPPLGLSPLLGTPGRGFASPGLLLSGPAGVPVGEDFLAFNSDLRIETIDGEGTFAFDKGNFSMLFAVGGRYLQMAQNYEARLSNIVAPGTSEQASLSAGRNFYGGGPTIAMQARWQFGYSGMSVFGNVRGSLLVGSSRQTASFTESIVDPTTGAQASFATNESSDEITVPVGELEGGFEYGRVVGRTRLFVRGAVVNHTYFDAGSASSRDGSMSLFGAQVSLGLNY
jgi:hypothetical protein